MRSVFIALFHVYVYLFHYRMLNCTHSLQTTKDEPGPDIFSLRNRRISVENSSIDGSRSITSQSQSETRSYRDRLKDRFQHVKVSVTF